MLYQTPQDKKLRGSTFCRKDCHKLQNEDPRLNMLSDAKKQEIEGVFIWRKGCPKPQTKDLQVNTLSDAKRQEIEGVFILEKRPPKTTKGRPSPKCFVRRHGRRNREGLHFGEKAASNYIIKTLA